jgi:Zn-dependent M28 family amino/carboxypeptidase
MRKAGILLPLAAALGAVAVAAGPGIAPADYIAHVKFLSSPELKGRRTGTPELDRAAKYVAAHFRTAGLAPLSRGYFQEYEVTVRTGLGGGSRAGWRDGSTSVALTERRDAVPLSVSGNGAAKGGVVFAGYGITAPEFKYDDYAGVDVKGKIVLVLRHEPQEADDKSVFDGKRLTAHAGTANKLVNAKQHGARAVLLVNDTPNHPGEDDGLEKIAGGIGQEDIGIPAQQITGKAAERLLQSSHKDLAGLVSAIDRELHPHSFALDPSIVADVAVDPASKKRHTRNVAGYLAGESDEYVVMGAHYDHLGLGEQHSLAPSQAGTVHPGADDNASGTAGVLELARYLAAQPHRRRGFLFLAFSGEEEGVLGSGWYTAHPLKPLAGAVAMINLDMIGRLRDGKVFVGGRATGSTFQDVLARTTVPGGLVLEQAEAGGYGGSDDASFTAHQVPTLFFFSGLHSDYHKPSDTWDKINAADAVRLLETVAGVATSLAEAPARPQFVRVQAAARPSASSGAGYGAYLGSVPDFGGPANAGVRFSDVRDGSPAAKAGLRAGDTLVEFDGKPVRNLYDLTYELQQHRPEDAVTLKVVRDGNPVEVKAVLGKRN